MARGRARAAAVARALRRRSASTAGAARATATPRARQLASRARALSLGGMSLPSKVVGFLEPRAPAAGIRASCVMGGALLFALPAVQLVGLARAARAPHVPAWARVP